MFIRSYCACYVIVFVCKEEGISEPILSRDCCHICVYFRTEYRYLTVNYATFSQLQKSAVYEACLEIFNAATYSKYNYVYDNM